MELNGSVLTMELERGLGDELWVNRDVVSELVQLVGIDLLGRGGEWIGKVLDLFLEGSVIKNLVGAVDGFETVQGVETGSSGVILDGHQATSLHTWKGTTSSVGKDVNAATKGVSQLWQKGDDWSSMTLIGVETTGEANRQFTLNVTVVELTTVTRNSCHWKVWNVSIVDLFTVSKSSISI